MSSAANHKSIWFPTARRPSICVLFLELAFLAMPAFGQHIHELYYNNAQWVDTDLSSSAGGPQVYPIGLTAFYTTPNDQLHVYYVSSGDFHIHQLYYNGSYWSNEDLTAAIGGATAYPGTGMSGFSIGNAQYVYFCASDLTVHEYSYGDGGNWNWADANLNGLTIGYPATCALYSEGMIAFATKPTNQRHLYFQGQGSNGQNPVRQLYFNGLRWSNENLTATIHGAKADGAWMAGFATGNFQYVFFEDRNGHIHQYSYVDNWKDLDLTAASRGAAASTFEPNGPAAYVVPGTTKMEVYYSTGQDLHQMTFHNNKWTDANLTLLTGGSAPYSLGQMVGFATTPNNQLHVYVNGQGGDAVDQFYFNGSIWSHEQLPSVPVAGLGPGMAGFAIGNYQHVYYVSSN